MNSNTKEIYEQMENDEFDGELIDKELVLDILNFSTPTNLYDWKYTKRFWLLRKSC